MNKRGVEATASRKNSIVRGILAAAGMIVEVTWIMLTFTVLNSEYEFLGWMMRIFAIVLVLSIYGMEKNGKIKTSWMLLILAFPLLGTVMFVLSFWFSGTKKMARRYQEVDSWLFRKMPQDPKIVEEYSKEHPHCAAISSYIEKESGFPVYDNTFVHFFGDTRECMNSIVQSLKLAEHFIFLEYHAIETAKLWGVIHPILLEKVKAGVEVRIFYDDIGSIGFLTPAFRKQMEAEGIRCRDFNMVRPVYNLFMNNRDHRKVTVIDGKIGFTGGFNLADEYVNLKHPYGEWKDSGVMLFGEAVRNLTVTFLEMWNADEPEVHDEEHVSNYFPEFPKQTYPGLGYIQPYADNPLDNHYIGENVYISILNRAMKYAYFTTPYLIPTDELIRAFQLAAQRGVDVRIITPAIPDKKLIFTVTRSYYHELVEAGVKIYEFSPGFIHAKQCVSDDELGTCGTINLDYRSFYHHFENGCFMAHCPVVKEIKKDFDELLPRCKDVSEKYRKKENYFLHFFHSFLRLFASLM